MAVSPETIEQLKTWCQENPVRLCVLFGSQAAGKAHPHSDVDLAIWPVEAVSTPTRLGWVRELETLLDRDISLVVVSADLDPVLGIEVFRHGHLIYESEPELWFHHRLQLWHNYNDSLPFLRVARQRLHKFAEEVRNDS